MKWIIITWTFFWLAPTALAGSAATIATGNLFESNKNKFTSIWQEVKSIVGEKPIQSYDAINELHESIHAVNSILRTRYNRDKTKKNGFYLRNGFFLVCEEPSFTLSELRQSIPKEDQGSNFNHYLAIDSVWENYPSYVFDEWIAYIYAAAYAVEKSDSGELENPRDVFSGVHEFATYVDNFEQLLTKSNSSKASKTCFNKLIAHLQYEKRNLLNAAQKHPKLSQTTDLSFWQNQK